MNLRKTLVLGCILAAALFYIIRVDQPHVKDLEKKDLLYKNLSASEIESIEISRTGSAFVLKNNAPKEAPKELDEDKTEVFTSEQYSSWQIASIQGATLEAAPTSGLISALQGIKLDNTLPAEEAESDLAAYGLKEPTLTVKVKSAAGEEQLQFGNLNAYVNMRYLKRNVGQTIYLVPEYVFSAANKQQNDFRSRTPIRFQDSELKRITLNTGKNQTVAEMDPKEGWKIVSAPQVAAGRQQISDLLRNVRELKAQEFFDSPADLNTYGLKSPALKITLDFKESSGKKLDEILIGVIPAGKDKEEKSYFKIEGIPSVFLLATNPLANINKTADDLREKKLVAIEPAAVSEATIEGKSIPTVSMVRKDGRWTVNGKKGDFIFIQQLFTDLSQLEAQTFPVDDKNATFDAPTAKVVLKIEAQGNAPQTEKTLTVGKEYKGKDLKGYYAQISGVNYPITISEESFKKMTPREEALVDTKTPETTPVPTLATTPK